MHNNLKEIRVSKNVSQRLLAEVVGISRPVIGNIENCKTAPRLDVMMKICNYLNVSIDDVYR